MGGKNLLNDLNWRNIHSVLKVGICSMSFTLKGLGTAGFPLCRIDIRCVCDRGAFGRKKVGSYIQLIQSAVVYLGPTVYQALCQGLGLCQILMRSLISLPHLCISFFFFFFF